MAVKKAVKMRVLLGKDPMVDTPWIAGALDESTVDALGEEGFVALVEEWKLFHTHHATYSYEWREVWISVPAEKLQQVFDPKPIAAEVEA